MDSEERVELLAVVSNAAGDRVFVTLSYPGQVLEIGASAGRGKALNTVR